ACALPLLRKDFVVDPFQVYEARSIGADCLLLIVALLDRGELRELADTALSIGLDLLVEVHGQHELDDALNIETALIGVNNRDLHTFETSLETTLRLARAVPRDRVLVSESGIHSRDDVARLAEHGVRAFLVGEAFMRAPDPGDALEQLFLEAT